MRRSREAHERALALVTRALDFNPHPGWCHMVAGQCRQRRGEDEDQEALQLAKRPNMSGLVRGEVFLAGVRARRSVAFIRGVGP